MNPEELDQITANIRQIIKSALPKSVDCVFILGHKDNGSAILQSGGNLSEKDSLSMLKLFLAFHPNNEKQKETLQ